MTNKRIYIIVISSFILLCINCCQKELNYQGKNLSIKASGYLVDSLGICQEIIIVGQYLKDSLLNKSNSIEVNVNIITSGKYVIYTDTVNGCWFMDTGIVTKTGNQKFTLLGYGKPIKIVKENFIVYFENSVCNFTTPAQKAIYSFDGISGSCPKIKVNGTYLTGATLNIANSVNIPVNVIIPGTYLIETSPVNNMVFTAKGTFTNTGTSYLTLLGTGIPLQEEKTIIPITINKTACSFFVDVALDTTMYWEFTAEGVNYFELLRDSMPSINPITLTGSTNKIFALTLQNTGDTSLNKLLLINLETINHPFVTGIYTPGAGTLSLKDFEGDFFFTKNNNKYLLQSDTSLAGFKINVDTYDLASGLLKGSFSGPVYKVASLNDFTNASIVNITNGNFKAYIRHQ